MPCGPWSKPCDTFLAILFVLETCWFKGELGEVRNFFPALCLGSHLLKQKHLENHIVYVPFVVGTSNQKSWCCFFAAADSVRFWNNTQKSRKPDGRCQERVLREPWFRDGRCQCSWEAEFEKIRNEEVAVNMEYTARWFFPTWQIQGSLNP